jgi:hypothetical protein
LLTLAIITDWICLGVLQKKIVPKCSSRNSLPLMALVVRRSNKKGVVPMINEDKKTKKIVRQKLTESFIASVEGKDKPQVYLLENL